MQQTYDQQYILRVNDELQLLEMYERVKLERLQKTQILARLKQILESIPNYFQADQRYKETCNEQYLKILVNEICSQEYNKRKQVLYFLYRVVSLRVKFWFKKVNFQNMFKTFIMNIQNNPKIAIHIFQFFIELCDTIQSQNQNLTERFPHLKNNHNVSQQSLQSKHLQSQSQSQSHSTRNNASMKFGHHALNRVSDRRKTTMRYSLSHIEGKKQRLRKANRFQREFIDYQLNKILSFANQMFRSLVVENAQYDKNDENNTQYSFSTKDFLCISKLLELIHKIITYDFFDHRTHNQVDQYLNDKSPIILPTKVSKHCQYSQFETWIKNKEDFYAYQYIYYYSGYHPIQITIVRMFGDLFRIHQRYFKTVENFKNHLESILTPLKCILQNHQIRNNNQYELAIALGQNIGKILSSLAFPMFVNYFRIQDKVSLLVSLKNFFLQKVLDQNIIDSNLIRFFIGFFVQIQQKCEVTTFRIRKLKIFKEQIEINITQIGDSYQTCLYNQDAVANIEPQVYLMTLKEVVNDFLTEDFQVFFRLFKVYTPKVSFRSDYSTYQQCIYICAKMENSLTTYEIYSKKFVNFQSLPNFEQDEQQYMNITNKYNLCIRYMLQCVFKLTEMLNRKIPVSEELTITEDVLSNILEEYGFKLMTAHFILKKVNFCQVKNLQILRQNSDMFSLTKTIIECCLSIRILRKLQFSHNFSLGLSSKLQDLIQFSHQIIALTVTLNKKINQAVNSFSQSKKQVKSMINSKRQSYKLDSSFFLEGQADKEKLKADCESYVSQLLYFQFLQNQILNSWNAQFALPQLKKKSSRKSQSFQLMSNFETNLCNHQLIEELKLCVKQQQFTTIVEPINQLYFIVLQKYQLHMQEHCNFAEKQEKIIKKSDTYKNGYNEQDELQVLEQQSDNQQVAVKISKILCVKTLKKQDFSTKLNPLSYFVFLTQITNSNSFRQRMQAHFIKWVERQLFQKIEQQQNTSISNLKAKVKSAYEKIEISYYQNLYNLPQIMRYLTQQYFLSQKQQQLQKSLTPYTYFYLFKCCTILLKIFTSNRYGKHIKQHVIESCYSFLNNNIQQCKNKKFYIHQNSSQLNQDSVIAGLLQASTVLLLLMLSSLDENLSIYSLNFGIVQQSVSNQSQNQVELDQDSICEIEKLNPQVLKRMLASCQKSSQTTSLLIKILQLLESFSIKQIRQSQHLSLQTQIQNTIDVICTQFPYFTTINLLKLFTWNNNSLKIRQITTLFDQVYTKKVERNYKIEIVQQNHKEILHAFFHLIRFCRVCTEYSSDLFMQSTQSNNLIVTIHVCVTQISNFLSVLPKYAISSLFSPQNQDILIEIGKIISNIQLMFKRFLDGLEGVQYHPYVRLIQSLRVFHEFYCVCQRKFPQNSILYLKIVQNKQNLNLITVFKRLVQFVKLQEQNRSKTKQSSKDKKLSQKIHDSKHSGLQLVSYRGWQYIELVCTSEDIDSLWQQIEQYQLKFKHLIKMDFSEKQCQLDEQNNSQLEETHFSQPCGEQAITENSQQSSMCTTVEEENIGKTSNQNQEDIEIDKQQEDEEEHSMGKQPSHERQVHDSPLPKVQMLAHRRIVKRISRGSTEMLNVIDEECQNSNFTKKKSSHKITNTKQDGMQAHLNQLNQDLDNQYTENKQSQAQKQK